MNINQYEIESLKTQNREVNNIGVDKIKIFNWKVSGVQGTFRHLHKKLLKINAVYQRDALTSKVCDIARDWSWVGCGAIVVTYRDGTFWVVDGQHRVLAAQSRSDIAELPCLVFELSDIPGEAKAFLDLNTGRKAVTAIVKQKAQVVAGDETAIFVQQEIDRLGLRVSTTTSPNSIKAVAWCTKRAREDRDSFSLVLGLAAELSRKDSAPVRERLLDGLLFIHNRVDGGILDKRLNKRLKEKGADALFAAANKASAFYGNGGAKVWGEGIVAELNRGLVHKFQVNPAGPFNHIESPP
ncbi:MAG: hypothetical protein HQ445_05460 [Polaromonas sp.]|nr:hypothetical protein [Polaromonas sp.]